MSVFITSILELSQNFFKSDPLKFNQYFAITPDYQKYCLAANLPTRFTITLAKEAMLIHDIAIHLLAGGCKLTTGTVKGICEIASGILGLETDHQTSSKQAVVHIGFAFVYTVDFFVSITNINKTYPQHLIDKIKNVFINFLEVSNKEIPIKYIADPEIEKALKKKQAEAEEKELALQEEQRKAKEQEKLLKKTQQELKDLRDNDFIPEEELEKISQEAKKIAVDTATHKKKSIQEEPTTITTSYIIDNKKQCTDLYKLTSGIESDDDTDSLIQKKPKNPELFWLEDELSKDKNDTGKEEEDGPFKNESVILETKKVTSPKKKKNAFSTNSPLTKSAFTRRKEYAKSIKKPPKKTLTTKS
ncbi:hypothetical protein RHABOEDO_001585 [Candidatus Rhabdochlamydia oedothoracis]|uniref:Uncharacterized protein n=1 Tax=Candidatus Rhabdochlamydia oedothoracis TaxID=2720720 RepID=A0ABX8V261_9BACT|nr:MULTISPECIES: hypothetical protein [Rhabdochlamydia]KAG6559444.1 hypothetical protein RHOW815_000565 [Candidatus Rhabdochlamydia sp. W815]QYF49279.1 hypothetical protein RHABOEDO_001585 [Candidatus Rhabdochlamydia oedothoracis]